MENAYNLEREIISKKLVSASELFYETIASKEIKTESLIIKTRPLDSSYEINTNKVFIYCDGVIYDDLHILNGVGSDGYLHLSTMLVRNPLFARSIANRNWIVVDSDENYTYARKGFCVQTFIRNQAAHMLYDNNNKYAESSYLFV